MSKTTLCCHRIDFWYNDDELTTLTEYEEERIEQLIVKGCHEGELCTLNNNTDEEVYGWWKIER